VWSNFENVVSEGLILKCFPAYCFDCGVAKYIFAQIFHLALQLLAEYTRKRRSLFVNTLKGKYYHFPQVIQILGISLLYGFQILVSLQIKVAGRATGYGMGGQGIESGGVRFFAHIQTGHWAHPPSCKKGTGVSRGFGFVMFNRPVR
jgi:hypothetical protein